MYLTKLVYVYKSSICTCFANKHLYIITVQISVFYAKVELRKKCRSSVQLSISVEICVLILIVLYVYVSYNRMCMYPIILFDIEYLCDSKSEF